MTKSLAILSTVFVIVGVGLFVFTIVYVDSWMAEDAFSGAVTYEGPIDLADVDVMRRLGLFLTITGSLTFVLSAGLADWMRTRRSLLEMDPRVSDPLGAFRIGESLETGESHRARARAGETD